jgi:hypothetical protein
MVLCRHHNLP